MGITTELQQEYDFEIVDEFVDHFSVMCDIMEIVIIGLEKPSEYAHNIQELFRIFHNIKSASSFLKIEPVMHIAILTEDLLSMAREMEGPAEATFVNWLLLVRDQYFQWSQDLLNDSDLAPTNPEITATIPTTFQRT